MVSLASFLAAAPLNPDAKTHIPVGVVNTAVSVECGPAHYVLVAVHEANPAASRSIGTGGVVHPNIFLKVALRCADRLHAAPAVAIGGDLPPGGLVAGQKQDSPPLKFLVA